MDDIKLKTIFFLSKSINIPSLIIYIYSWRVLAIQVLCARFSHVYKAFFSIYSEYKNCEIKLFDSSPKDGD